jgi:hypothetical protein
MVVASNPKANERFKFFRHAQIRSVSLLPLIWIFMVCCPIRYLQVLRLNDKSFSLAHEKISLRIVAQSMSLPSISSNNSCNRSISRPKDFGSDSARKRRRHSNRLIRLVAVTDESLPPRRPNHRGLLFCSIISSSIVSSYLFPTRIVFESFPYTRAVGLRVA